ncbi:MAG: FGGY-family carbohydrate kinase [Succinivibrionaceae bacterium]|nr:FGGY-family carbohydrate kinase [Succinivibrionaceae bacterium]
MSSSAKDLIAAGKTALGIELGSTRIKGVLIDYEGNVLATGAFEWENSLVNGVWTYALEDAEKGVAACYAQLKAEVKDKYGVTPKSFGAIGVSAMMHGYIALDKDDRQLAPFQTWRNTNTTQAADELTSLLDFNIPLRWSVAHLYQRLLDGEAHVKDIDKVFTLAAWLHYRLTGQMVIGVGDAAGMFPIDSNTMDYDEGMVGKFDALMQQHGSSLRLRKIFPKVLVAGDSAGSLTAQGAALLDPEGDLGAGVPLCPPEGDAGTGMTATNSVAPRTGNLSAGTSSFAMVVLEHKLSKVYREIDMVATPSGFPCAMSHANNGTTDLNAWVGMFGEFCELMGIKADPGTLYTKLYQHAMTGDHDCGGLLAYGYHSGENVTFINEGRPLFARMPGSNFNLANFMRSHLYTSLGAVKLGMDILLKDEKVKLDCIMGHGGLFKTPGVMQNILAAALNTKVAVMETASEGGAWGIALLAAYMADGKGNGKLEDYLNQRIFSTMAGKAVDPDPEDVKGFATFTERYVKGLDIERAAIAAMDW